MADIALMGVKGGPAIRPGSNMPTSILVRIGGMTVLVDAGLGACRGICDQGVALGEIDLVLVTHLHSDHYLELGPFFHTAWTCGLARPIPVIGPSGLTCYWTHFLQAMDFDVGLRIRDEGRCALEPLFDHRTIGEGIVFERDGLRIEALRNLHPPIEESFALRFEAEGKRLVLSGDTAFMPEMVDFSSGADLLVHEALLPAGVEALIARVANTDDRLRTHLLRSHTTAEDTGRLAQMAQVRALALNHFVPDGDPRFDESHWTADVRKHWSGPLHLGRDGMRIAF